VFLRAGDTRPGAGFERLTPACGHPFYMGRGIGNPLPDRISSRRRPSMAGERFELSRRRADESCDRSFLMPAGTSPPGGLLSGSTRGRDPHAACAAERACWTEKLARPISLKRFTDGDRGVQRARQIASPVRVRSYLPLFFRPSRTRRLLGRRLVRRTSRGRRAASARLRRCRCVAGDYRRARIVARTSVRADSAAGI
jgi:hypothetical protein